MTPTSDHIEKKQSRDLQMAKVIAGVIGEIGPRPSENEKAAIKRILQVEFEDVPGELAACVDRF